MRGLGELLLALLIGAILLAIISITDHSGRLNRHEPTIIGFDEKTKSWIVKR